MEQQCNMEVQLKEESDGTAQEDNRKIMKQFFMYC